MPTSKLHAQRLCVALLLGLLGWQLAFAQVPEGVTEYELPGDGVFPEGVAYHEASGTFFVSGAGSGGIYRVDVASGEVSEFLAPGTRQTFTTIGLATTADQLWVAGGNSGEIVFFDIESGEQAGSYTTPEADARFLNDVVVTELGAFITDSNRPVLWHVGADAVAGTPEGEAEEWLSFVATPFEYVEGFNANGIVASEDGAILIVVAANSGTFYRIDVASKEVSAIDLDGEPVLGGDGMVLDGQTLYVVQNGADQVTVITLTDDFASGTVERVIADERLTGSATAALVGDDLLVTNSQFSAMQGEPSLPFTVSVVPTAAQ